MSALVRFNNFIGTDKDIVILGGDRPANSSLGARDKGQHSPQFKTAADIYVKGQVHLQTANQAIDSKIFSGIGWYEEGYRGPQGEGPHVHVDLRTDRTVNNPAKWGYTKDSMSAGPIPKYIPPKNEKECP